MAFSHDEIVMDSYDDDEGFWEAAVEAADSLHGAKKPSVSKTAGSSTNNNFASSDSGRSNNNFGNNNTFNGSTTNGLSSSTSASHNTGKMALSKAMGGFQRASHNSSSGGGGAAGKSFRIRSYQVQSLSLSLLFCYNLFSPLITSSLQL